MEDKKTTVDIENEKYYHLLGVIFAVSLITTALIIIFGTLFFMNEPLLFK